jgi:FkbM family methyltransferase
MRILDERGKLIDTNFVEAAEQKMVKDFLHEDDVVLELGARYGSVSCTINQILKNKKNQVSVEPDYRVWSSLEMNRDSNECEFEIVRGFVSKEKLNIVAKGYDTTFTPDETSNVDCLTLDEIEGKFNLSFNVLVADCEGFLEIFFEENPNLYDRLDKVIFEADREDFCNYATIRENLRSRGFHEHISGHQNAWTKE